MRKKSAFFAICVSLFILCFTGCTQSHRPASQPTPSDVPVNENVNPSNTQEPETNPSTQPEQMVDEFLGSVAYCGYGMYAGEVNAWEILGEAVPNVCNASGEEAYLIVPPDEDSTITIYSMALSEEGENEVSQVLGTFTTPVLLYCNLSDIVPNTQVSIDSKAGTVCFSPYVSLKDGSVSLPETVQNITSNQIEDVQNQCQQMTELLHCIAESLGGSFLDYDCEDGDYVWSVIRIAVSRMAAYQNPQLEDPKTLVVSKDDVLSLAKALFLDCEELPELSGNEQHLVSYDETTDEFTFSFVGPSGYDLKLTSVEYTKENQWHITASLSLSGQEDVVSNWDFILVANETATENLQYPYSVAGVCGIPTYDLE